MKIWTVQIRDQTAHSVQSDKSLVLSTLRKDKLIYFLKTRYLSVVSDSYLVISPYLRCACVILQWPCRKTNVIINGDA